jgi:hypothetical protein
MIELPELSSSQLLMELRGQRLSGHDPSAVRRVAADEIERLTKAWEHSHNQAMENGGAALLAQEKLRLAAEALRYELEYAGDGSYQRIYEVLAKIGELPE